MLWRAEPPVNDVPRELRMLGGAFGSAVDRFRRELLKEASRQPAGRLRRGVTTSRLPVPHVHRPVPHPLRLPKVSHFKVPPTVLDRRRRLEDRERGGPPPVVVAAQQAARRFVIAVRSVLITLHEVLRRLPTHPRVDPRWAPSPELPVHERGVTPTNDRLLSVLALAAVAVWTLAVISHPRPALEMPAPEQIDVPLPGVLDARVEEIATAVAMAEGYYASGEHDGHSLPYRLNNPGALKKPALGAALLPTWKDTGIVEFPTKEMGWTALRHQVRGMVSGTSRVYDPSDSLLAVAEKYADGDLNWGWNVAARLGVHPAATLADLASGEARRDEDLSAGRR